MYAPGKTNEMVTALTGELVRQVIKWFQDKEVKTEEEKEKLDKDNLGKIDLILRTFKASTIISDAITDAQVWWDDEVEGLDIPDPSRNDVRNLQQAGDPDDVVVQAQIITDANMPDGAVCRHKVTYMAALFNAAGFPAHVRASAAMKHAIVEVQIGPQPHTYLVDPENTTAIQLLGSGYSQVSGGPDTTQYTY